MQYLTASYTAKEIACLEAVLQDRICKAQVATAKALKDKIDKEARVLEAAKEDEANGETHPQPQPTPPITHCTGRPRSHSSPPAYFTLCVKTTAFPVPATPAPDFHPSHPQYRASSLPNLFPPLLTYGTFYTVFNFIFISIITALTPSLPTPTFTLRTSLPHYPFP